MARPHRQAVARLQRRIESFNISDDRIRRHDYKPNATGPKTKYHKPGSMNAHKSYSKRGR